MPSINSLAFMAAGVGGAGLGGYLGWKKATNDQLSMEDKLSFTTSSVVASAAAGLISKQIGFGGFYRGGKAALTTARMAGKAMMWNPLKPLAKKMGRTNFGFKAIPKGMRGPLGLLAMFVGGTAAVAYGSRSNPKPVAYSSTNEYGETEYNTTSVKERMSMLGAAGNMVFGLNNMRHG